MSVYKEKFVYGNGSVYYLDVVDQIGYSISYVYVYKKVKKRFLFRTYYDYVNILKGSQKDYGVITTKCGPNELIIEIERLIRESNSNSNSNSYMGSWDKTINVTDEYKKQFLRNSSIDDILDNDD